VRENIVRHIHMGKDHYAAAREGTDEIGLAVLATTLSIVAVFVPIAFMSGIVGKFFFPFGITVAAAVLVSLFVSFTLDPMLSAVWRDPPEGARGLPFVGPMLRGFERLLDRVHAIYDRLLRWALAHRKSALAIATASFLAAIPIGGIVGTEMMPEADQSFTSVRLTMPVGSSLEYANERVKRVEEALRGVQESMQSIPASASKGRVTRRWSTSSSCRAASATARSANSRRRSASALPASQGWN
jgi:multidrug efflux pump subunit AcrB